MRLYNNDYRSVKLDRKVDFILTDIPYNIGLNAYASNPQWWKDGDFKNGKSERAKSEFFKGDSNFSIDDLLSYIYDNLVDNGKAVVFCSIEELAEFYYKYKSYNFTRIQPLIFIKNNSAEVLKSNMRIVGACEYGVILYKNSLGKFNNDRKMIKNWFNFELVRNRLHPNEKPIDLLKMFINLYTDIGDVVLDMCMGSGTTGVACKELHRDFIGIEIDEHFYNVASNRIVGGNKNE